MMKNGFLWIWALSGLLILPQTQAQQGYDFTENEGYDFSENEGYDFSDDEEEIAAQKKSADDKRALQSLLWEISCLNPKNYAILKKRRIRNEKAKIDNRAYRRLRFDRFVHRLRERARHSFSFACRRCRA